jgi:carboxynorspermidine decarboxylase
VIDYNKIPSPCYVIDEKRFRQNLSLIKNVSEQSGAEIILAFKAFAMWGVFPILREYVKGAAASSADEARLCFDEIGSPAHTYAPAFRESESQWRKPGIRARWLFIYLFGRWWWRG